MTMEKSQQKRSFNRFFNKYFLHGQELSDEQEISFIETQQKESFDEILLQKCRKFFAFLLPFLIAQVIWWSIALRNDFLSLYQTLWPLPVTMILGATVAGMTAEGSGAVAFPVMTFILQLSPTTARDFTVSIQSIGMSCAFFSLLFMKIRIEWRAIIYSFMGAIPGVIIGFETVDIILSAPVKKMIFVSVWSSFAMSLYMLNCEKKRITTSLIQNFSPWKIVVLVFTGFIGGIFTSFAGSGVDICTFSTITFLFRVSEKTATPTTVVIMALTSQFCFFYRGLVVADFDPLAFEYFKVCIPVVVFFAPFGSFLGSHFHRIVCLPMLLYLLGDVLFAALFDFAKTFAKLKTLAWLVCILEIFAMIGFLATLPPWTLLVSAVLIMFFGFILFSMLADLGDRLMVKEAQQNNNSKALLFIENC